MIFQEQSKTVTEQDRKDARKLYEVLARKGLLTHQRHNLNNWAKCLAATRRRHPDQYRKVLRFHIKQLGTKYCIRAYCAKAFQSRFEDIAQKRKEHKAQEVPDVTISQQTKDIVRRLSDGPWSEAQLKELPAVVQRSMDNLCPFVDKLTKAIHRLKKLGERSNLHQRLSRFGEEKILWHIRNVGEFVEGHFFAMRKWAGKCSSMKLSRRVLSPESEEFVAEMREIARHYEERSSQLWDQLYEEVKNV